MISEDVIQRIKAENDIVDIISEKVSLKRSGRNYLGLCPFHNEKTPSFSVSRDKQIYKCFGCGEAGNVITFVMKSQNLGFLEAIELLADRVNIDIDLSKNNRKSTFENLYKLNVEAAKYYFYSLNKNKYAKSYLLNRGITEHTIMKFGLGYSNDGWNHMMSFLKNKGFTESDMVSNGLIIRSEKGNYYDRFRNRIMFPVFDYRGKIIGFGGRVLDDSKPKYLNSPETPLFKKGVNLYGLNFAIKSNMSRTLIIVEGYMDCIALHQYGIKNVVASLGTALTVNQAKLMARYVDKVILSYDADKAGEIATLRSMSILKNVGLEVKILSIPQGKDPDEFIRKNGRQSFLELVEKADDLIDYRVKNIKKNIDFNNPQDVVKYTERVLKILVELNPIEREIHIKRLWEDTGIKEQTLYDMLNITAQKNVKKDVNVNIDMNFGQKLYLEPAYLKAERAFLKLILENNEAFKYSLNKIKNDELILESHKKIYEYIIENIKYNDPQKRKKCIESKCVDIDTSKEWVNIMETEVQCDSEEWMNMLHNFINRIKKYKLEEYKKNIIGKIKECESKGNLEESLEFAQQLMEIQKRIGEIQ